MDEAPKMWLCGNLGAGFNLIQFESLKKCAVGVCLAWFWPTPHPTGHGGAAGVLIQYPIEYSPLTVFVFACSSIVSWCYVHRRATRSPPRPGGHGEHLKSTTSRPQSRIKRKKHLNATGHAQGGNCLRVVLHTKILVPTGEQRVLSVARLDIFHRSYGKLRGFINTLNFK